MNRSYSKIRHIQESNIFLERRRLNEQENVNFLDQFIRQFLNKYEFQVSGPSTDGTVTYVKTVPKNDKYMEWNTHDTLYLIFNQTATPKKVKFTLRGANLDKDHVEKSSGKQSVEITNDNNGTSTIQQMLDFDKEHNGVNWDSKPVYF